MVIKKKLVSIIIPVYNAENYLSETLDSVLSQTYSNWECIIIDDGSIDSSSVIALDYAEKDSRFTYHYQQNFGPSVARNKGIEFSSGEFIQFLDADDILLPDRLTVMLKHYANSDDYIIYYSNMLIGENDNIYQTSQFRQSTHICSDVSFDEMYRRFGVNFLFIPSCLLIHRNTIGKVRWNESISHSEDWDFYLRLLRKKYLFRYIDIPLILYRNTPDSLSKNFIKTITANYKILETWANKNNWIHFSKRCGLLMKRNIFLYLTKKVNRIVIPYFRFSKSHRNIMVFFSLMIVPYTISYLIFDFMKILNKKLR